MSALARHALVLITAIMFSVPAIAADGYYSRTSGTAQYPAGATACDAAHHTSGEAYRACYEALLVANVAPPGGACAWVVDVAGPSGSPPSYIFTVNERYTYFSPACGGTALASQFGITLTNPPTCDYGSWDAATGCPEPPPECELPATTSFMRSTGSSVASGDICMAAYNCVATNTGGICLGSTCYTSYQMVDSDCEETDDPGPVSASDGAGKCLSSGGLQVCADPKRPEQAEVAGTSVNPENFPPGGCAYLSNGGMLCDPLAAAPPAPDDGTTPDIPATANGDVTIGGDEYNYYNSSTVSGSSGPTEGAPDGSLGDGGEGEGDCEGSDCVGTLPGDNEEVESFASLTQGFLDRIEAAPLVAATTGILDSMPAGTCEGEETGGLAMFGGESLELDVHCTVWDEVSGVISAVMLAAWVLLGVFIVLRA